MTDMKRFIFIIFSLLLPLFFCGRAEAAENAILTKVKSANAAVKTIESSFTQSRTIKAAGRTIKSSGTLYYDVTGKMSMFYDAPSSDLLVINGTSFYMKRGGRGSTFDTSKNTLMRDLSSTLLNCLGGKVQEVADANNASVWAEEVSGTYLVTLKARKVATKGYSRIVLTYRKSDCLLVKMQMDEFGGISTIYSMSGIKTGSGVSADKFAIPAK